MVGITLTETNTREKDKHAPVTHMLKVTSDRNVFIQNVATECIETPEQQTVECLRVRVRAGACACKQGNVTVQRARRGSAPHFLNRRTRSAKRRERKIKSSFPRDKETR